MSILAGCDEEKLRSFSERRKLTDPAEAELQNLQKQFEIDAEKQKNLMLENEHLKDRLMELENNYRSLEYSFKKTLNDQQYLVSVISSEEKLCQNRPQLKRITDELNYYLSSIDSKKSFAQILDENPNGEDQERISAASHQIRLRPLIKPSKFYHRGSTDQDSSSSPDDYQERPAKTLVPEMLKSKEEEMENLDIQPFASEKQSPELRDQIIESPLEEENEGSLQRCPLIPQFSQRFGQETIASPQIKVKTANQTVTSISGVNFEDDQEKYINEIIRRHRHTFSRRIMDISKSEKPEEIEQSYMNAMGKSIIAFNYKSQISKNPLKKFSTLCNSIEESKTPEINAFSPSNKVILIPVHKFFKMGSMQEIELLSASNRSHNTLGNNSQIENRQSPAIERIETVSPLTSVIQEQNGSDTPQSLSSGHSKIGQKIFEDLIIIGVDKSDINSMSQKQIEGKNLTLNPKVLYSFRSEEEMPDLIPIKKILPEYCFPYKVNVEKIDIGSSMSYTSVLMVMYPTHNIYEGRDKCFIMTLSCEETYKNHSEDGSFLHKINPNRIVHCICYQTVDYIESSDPSVITQKDQKKGKLHRKFWTCPKVYCFVTFYPIVRFFFDLLVEITNNLKLFRLEVMDRFVDSIKKEYLYQIDSDFLTALIQEHIEVSLKQLQTYKIPSFGEKITLKLKRLDSNLLGYQLQHDPDFVEYEEALWGAPLTFSNLPLEDFIFLLFSFLLETKIVFFSTNMSLLTSTILTFFNLIKPVKWVHPILCSLPDSLLDFLGSPVPILAGINQSRQYFKENRFASIYPDCLYYFLDDNKLSYDENNIKETLRLIPSMNHFKKQLAAKFYKTFTRLLSKIFDFEVSSPKKTWKQFKGYLKDSKIYTEKFLIYVPNAEQESKAFEIFQLFRNIMKGIFDNLPETPRFIDEAKINLNQEYIVEEVCKKYKNKKDKEFLKRFLKTQVAMSHIEGKYHLNDDTCR